ncbi:MAG: hypothetical protein ACOCXP_03240, partial [Candidatus Dojkabacteria bacterium]
VNEQRLSEAGTGPAPDLSFARLKRTFSGLGKDNISISGEIKEGDDYRFRNIEEFMIVRTLLHNVASKAGGYKAMLVINNLGYEMVSYKVYDDNPGTITDEALTKLEEFYDAGRETPLSSLGQDSGGTKIAAYLLGQRVRIFDQGMDKKLKFEEVFRSQTEEKDTSWTKYIEVITVPKDTDNIESLRPTTVEEKFISRLETLLFDKSLFDQESRGFIENHVHNMGTSEYNSLTNEQLKQIVRQIEVSFDQFLFDYGLSAVKSRDIMSKLIKRDEQESLDSQAVHTPGRGGPVHTGGSAIIKLTSQLGL